VQALLVDGKRQALALTAVSQAPFTHLGEGPESGGVLLTARARNEFSSP
jgi:hypothetical protein